MAENENIIVDGEIVAEPTVKSSQRPILLAMVGLPRSGKSTWANKFAVRLGAPVVCRDSIRLALTGQRYQALAEPMVKALSKLMIRSLFYRGHGVVICDETNVSKAARDYLKEDGWEVVYFPVLTDPEVCKERARATNQEDLIPIIDEMWARFEPLTPEDKILEVTFPETPEKQADPAPATQA